jgi:hypothetical protein
VRTTRIERRGLESERRTGINLRMEFEGAAEAVEVRVSEAFWGRNSEEVEDVCCAALRALCRLRCGSSSVEGGRGGVRSDVTVVFEASFPPIGSESATVEVKAPLLPFAPILPSKVFGEKYPVHNRGVVPAIVALTFDALENALLPSRLGLLAVNWRQDRHTVLRPLDRKALDGGYRIIIACRCWVHKMSVHFLSFPA